MEFDGEIGAFEKLDLGALGLDLLAMKLTAAAFDETSYGLSKGVFSFF